jgi:hypothetical protein
MPAYAVRGPTPNVFFPVAPSAHRVTQFKLCLNPGDGVPAVNQLTHRALSLDPWLPVVPLDRRAPAVDARQSFGYSLEPREIIRASHT